MYMGITNEKNKTKKTKQKNPQKAEVHLKILV